ncbi:hypothetical protein bcgnr5372_21190 [Bacillus luti]
MQKVVILMSSYNGEKYIREQIESIFAQSYRNIQLIVRDDGSTDSTIKILNEYAEQDRLSWYKGKNLKPARSFLELVKKAPVAEYYAFADQDDVWDSDKIEVAVKKLSQVKADTPALYCSATRLVDQDLAIINPVAHYKNYRLTFGEALVEIPSPGCTYVFNNDAREYLVNYEFDYIGMHDALLYRIVSGLGEIIYDKTPHISYRQHGGNVVGTENSMILNFLQRVERNLFSDEPNKKYKVACEIRKSCGHLFEGENLRTLETFTDYKKTFRNRIKFAFNREIKRTNKVDNVLFVILSLMGKV